MKKIRFVGLDVHAEKIAIAIAEHDGEVRFLGIVPNREDSVRRMMESWGTGRAFACAMRRGRPDSFCTGN